MSVPGVANGWNDLRIKKILVDWFDFWLNGHGDPTPLKPSQYAR